MNIKVCVGSSCHLKGSYDVIEKLKDVIAKYGVESVAELQASFCLGHCAEGVSLQLDEMDKTVVEKLGEESILVHNLNKDNVEEVFVNKIYPLITK